MAASIAQMLHGSLLALLVLSFGRLAVSCSCFFDPLTNLQCSNFNLVFTGTGLESVPESEPSPPPPDGGFFFPISFVNNLITVRVDKVIKDENGVLPPVGGNFTVSTALAGTSCETFLPLGIEYFLLLDSSDPTINACGKEEPVSNGNLPIIVEKCCPAEKRGTGDVDNNDILDVSDVVVIVNFIIDNSGPLSEVSCAFSTADNNEDGIVNIQDVVTFVDCLLTGQEPCE